MKKLIFFLDEISQKYRTNTMIIILTTSNFYKTFSVKNKLTQFQTTTLRNFIHAIASPLEALVSDITRYYTPLK